MPPHRLPGTPLHMHAHVHEPSCSPHPPARGRGGGGGSESLSSRPAHASGTLHVSALGTGAGGRNGVGGGPRTQARLTPPPRPPIPHLLPKHPVLFFQNLVLHRLRDIRHKPGSHELDAQGHMLGDRAGTEWGGRADGTRAQGGGPPVPLGGVRKSCCSGNSGRANKASSDREGCKFE